MEGVALDKFLKLIKSIINSMDPIGDDTFGFSDPEDLNTLLRRYFN